MPGLLISATRSTISQAVWVPRSLRLPPGWAVTDAVVTNTCREV